jgi:hypothetical protein
MGLVTTPATQDGRIYIEKINEPFPLSLYQLKGTPAEYKAGLDRAIAKGWLILHESGTYVRFIEAGAALFARSCDLLTGNKTAVSDSDPCTPDI